MLPNGPATSHAKRNGFQVLKQISANPRKYIDITTHPCSKKNQWDTLSKISFCVLLSLPHF